MEALLCIKLEGPEIKQFIKEHSSDAAASVGKQRNKEKEGIGNRKNIRNVFSCTNKFIDAFLESSGDEQETKQSDLVNQ